MGDGVSTSTVETDAKPGDRMPDGSVYAGISPDTNQPFYTTMADAPLLFTFDEAKEYAAIRDATDLDERGNRKGWRVPTKRELKVLYENRRHIGRFNLSGDDPEGWYWSSSVGEKRAWTRRFSDGEADFSAIYFYTSLRCVR